MSHPADTDIIQLVEEIAPESLLIVDLKEPDSLDGHLRQHPEWTVRKIHNSDVHEHITSSGQHDVAILRNTLEYLDKVRAGIVISRLRDVYSRRLLALVPIDSNAGASSQSTWQDADLIAYGMNQLAAYPDGRHLYEYNILNYKNVPDWLNAKNWANPELWDKYRW